MGAERTEGVAASSILLLSLSLSHSSSTTPDTSEALCAHRPSRRPFPAPSDPRLPRRVYLLLGLSENRPLPSPKPFSPPSRFYTRPSRGARPTLRKNRAPPARHSSARASGIPPSPEGSGVPPSAENVHDHHERENSEYDDSSPTPARELLRCLGFEGLRRHRAAAPGMCPPLLD